MCQSFTAGSSSVLLPVCLLVAWCLLIVIYLRNFSVDLNDRAISLPAVTHNIELRLKGQPLRGCLIFNFYFECNHQFYSRHQTLNTNISILNSLKGISLISAANAGFVFFISFTSLSLTFIMYSSYHIWEQVSSAWCLVLVAWRPSGALIVYAIRA